MSGSALAVQAALRSGVGLHGLRDTFAITSRRHREHANLVLLKYNQIDSPMGERIVQECRGIILDEADDWRVIGRGFDKFFNHGEGHAAPIDWSTARVEEKLDGSLCMVYAYDGDWHVATSGTPDASGQVHRSGLTFAELFWATMSNTTGYFRENRPLDASLCFLFELCTPFNRVVVPHEKASVTLLALRDRDSGQYLHTQAAGESIGVPSVRSFPLSSIADIQASFEHISPLSQEGYVVVDAAGNRIKVKHPGYVALHHAVDGLRLPAMVEIARAGETSEVEAAFPELRASLNEARGRVTALAAEVDADFARLSHLDTPKAFALEATKTKCPAALFALRQRRHETSRSFFASMHLKHLMSLLGYGDEAVAA